MTTPIDKMEATDKVQTVLSILGAETIANNLKNLKLSKPGSPQALLETYLLREPIFRQLRDLKIETALNSEADKHFAEQRKRADEADDSQNVRFYHMAVRVATEMQEATGALTIPESLMPDHPPMVLDLCMAPGGYSFSAQDVNPGAKVRAITLPVERGGHAVVVGVDGDSVVVEYGDITMYAAVMGLGPDDIPEDHPDKDNFRFDLPFHGSSEEFDLVFCDGQVLRTQERQSYRERHEAIRLLTSQLVIAFQRIREGGTLICLLHRVEDWTTAQLLYNMSKVADVQLFKPERIWGRRGSFYLVAKNVRPRGEEGKRAVAMWIDAWRRATFCVAPVEGDGESGYEVKGDEKTEGDTTAGEKDQVETTGGEKTNGKETDGKETNGKEANNEMTNNEEAKVKDNQASKNAPPEEPEEPEEVFLSDVKVNDLLRDYGPTLVKMGSEVWKIQHAAMLRAPYMKPQRQSRFESAGSPAEKPKPEWLTNPPPEKPKPQWLTGPPAEEAKPKWLAAKSWRTGSANL